MARVGKTEAAIRLGLSVDSIRRRVRKGEMNARRDNKGVWWLDEPDNVPIEPGKLPMLARQPMQCLCSRTRRWWIPCVPRSRTSGSPSV